jgi:hypothetical protein
MLSPFHARGLPNLFPDLDSLCVEFTSVVGKALVAAWINEDSLGAEQVRRNALAVGVMLPFWRVGKLLDLHRLGWLRKIHTTDRSETGELCTLLKTWENLTRTRNQSAASMLPHKVLKAVDYLLATPVPTGNALLAHLKAPSGIGELNADLILRDAYHFCDTALGCTDAYIFADGGCAAFHSEVLFIHPDQWAAAVGLAQTAIPTSVGRLLEQFPAFRQALPTDAIAMLTLKLLKTTTENHDCEGLKMIKALLVAEMGFKGKPWLGICKISNTKLTFDLMKHNRIWKPPTDRANQVAVPSADGEVALQSFHLYLNDEAHAKKLQVACQPLKQSLKARLQTMQQGGGDDSR